MGVMGPCTRPRWGVSACHPSPTTLALLGAGRAHTHRLPGPGPPPRTRLRGHRLCRGSSGWCWGCRVAPPQARPRCPRARPPTPPRALQAQRLPRCLASGGYCCCQPSRGTGAPGAAGHHARCGGSPGSPCHPGLGPGPACRRCRTPDSAASLCGDRRHSGEERARRGHRCSLTCLEPQGASGGPGILLMPPAGAEAQGMQCEGREVPPRDQGPVYPWHLSPTASKLRIRAFVMVPRGCPTVPCQGPPAAPARERTCSQVHGDTRTLVCARPGSPGAPQPLNLPATPSEFLPRIQTVPSPHPQNRPPPPSRGHRSQEATPPSGKNERCPASARAAPGVRPRPGRTFRLLQLLQPPQGGSQREPQQVGGAEQPQQVAGARGAARVIHQLPH